MLQMVFKVDKMNPICKENDYCQCNALTRKLTHAHVCGVCNFKHKHSCVGRMFVLIFSLNLSQILQTLKLA